MANEQTYSSDSSASKPKNQALSTAQQRRRVIEKPSWGVQLVMARKA